ncbi:MAG: cell division topological specificity factor MinE [Deltaproteobacteria bacterium]|nr:cell division topological specificity factor MinE [Deltaproteobacteria bacterium]
MIAGFIKRIMKTQASGDVAKQRLQIALVCDRLEVSKEVFGLIQQDMVQLLSRYFDIDTDGIVFNISRENKKAHLVINTPILRLKQTSAKKASKTLATAP